MVKQKKNLEETASEVEPIAVEEAVCEDKVQSLLEDVRKSEGVVGYIVKNKTSATIDLDDQAKVTDYAILSSSTFEAGEQLSELFDLGKIRNVRTEGKDAKMLHLAVGESDVSIFMEKTADTKKILEKMQTP